jgi:UDP-N-acetylglucosamine 2-epimerase (non-hydrolysing)
LKAHPRIHLIEPVPYPAFVALMKAAVAILTDSGGVQEEAPTFGTPVLVLRETTERPEGLEAGAARLVGTGRDAIVGAVEALFNRPTSGAPGANPYGDGWASERIARVLAARFGMDPGPAPPGFAPHWSPPAPPLGPIAEKRPRPVDGP